ncbi:MAG: hypothetical protein ACRDFQ_02375, partial [Anaerolineales bacterium]
MSRKISILRFVLILSLAAFIGIAAGTRIGVRTGSQTGISFQDGNQEFCADKGRLNVEIVTLDLEANKG